MWPLILGLILFLGPHSVRVVAPAWREARLAAWGPDDASGAVGNAARPEPPDRAAHAAGADPDRVGARAAQPRQGGSRAPDGDRRDAVGHGPSAGQQHGRGPGALRRLPGLGDAGFPVGTSPRAALAAARHRTGHRDRRRRRNRGLDRADPGAAPADHRRQPLPGPGRLKRDREPTGGSRCGVGVVARPALRGCGGAAAPAARSTAPPRPGRRRSAVAWPAGSR
ncbi:conserved hypothetical protein [Ricinus communis]|uniref:Uncharacterized protein n=1 Tax=Ricinus communis TaxID=3988 RepID=B9TII5_RICCO|nr:conserved hypothetical protein [Ricinus communis]